MTYLTISHARKANIQPTKDYIGQKYFLNGAYAHYALLDPLVISKSLYFK